MASLLIHRYRSEVANTPVNAYLVEGADGVVAVDATLTVSGGRGLRAQAEALGKPLLGVVLTHAHPDHYGGLVALLDGRDVPVFATARVSEVIRRDDPVKEQILRPMFGAEWAPQRAFPTEVVADGETVELGDIALTVTDLGPSESPADSLWALATTRAASSPPTSSTTARTATSPTGSRRNGSPTSAGCASSSRPAPLCTLVTASQAGLELLDWQEAYIETMLRAIRTPGRRRRGDDAFLPAIRDARVPDGAQRRAARSGRLTQLAGPPTPNITPRSAPIRRRRAPPHCSAGHHHHQPPANPTSADALLPPPRDRNQRDARAAASLTVTAPTVGSRVTRTPDECGPPGRAPARRRGQRDLTRASGGRTRGRRARRSLGLQRGRAGARVPEIFESEVGFTSPGSGAVSGGV